MKPGKALLRIPFAAVHKVALDKKRANLIIYFQEKNKQDKWVQRSREFFIDDAARRDQIFSVIRQRLGPGWKAREEQLTPLGAIGGHVVLIILTLVAIPCLLLLIHWLQGPDLLAGIEGGRLFYRIGRGVIHGGQALLRWLGIAVDILVYLAAAILVVIWTGMMITNLRMPPLMYYLEKGDAGRDPNIGEPDQR